MITEKDLREAIIECKIGEPNMNKIYKLSALVTVYDHLFGGKTEQAYSVESEPTRKPDNITAIGGSDFLRTVRGKDTAQVMSILNDAMQNLQAVQPKAYDAALRKISEL